MEQILKFDEEHRIVYGWASVTKVKDGHIVDHQGDILPTEVLVKAVNEFMESEREGRTMHEERCTGKILHSFPMTEEICKALGIASDKEGWITGFKVYDEQTWQDVKSGKYAAFSIGGAAVKEDYHEGNH